MRAGISMGLVFQEKTHSLHGYQVGNDDLRLLSSSALNQIGVSFLLLAHVWNVPPAVCANAAFS